MNSVTFTLTPKIMKMAVVIIFVIVNLAVSFTIISIRHTDAEFEFYHVKTLGFQSILEQTLIGLKNSNRTVTYNKYAGAMNAVITRARVVGDGKITSYFYPILPDSTKPDSTEF